MHNSDLCNNISIREAFMKRYVPISINIQHVYYSTHLLIMLVINQILQKLSRLKPTLVPNINFQAITNVPTCEIIHDKPVLHNMFLKARVMDFSTETLHVIVISIIFWHHICFSPFFNSHPSFIMQALFMSTKFFSPSPPNHIGCTNSLHLIAWMCFCSSESP